MKDILSKLSQLNESWAPADKDGTYIVHKDGKETKRFNSKAKAQDYAAKFGGKIKKAEKVSEGETKETGKGRVHKGTYGSEYETDREGNEKKKETTAVKKGRGRPKKDADSSGEVKTYDTKSLGSVFGGGQKPKKEVGTVSKKHSLKEFIESVEDTKNAEAVMEGLFGGVDHDYVAGSLGKLAKVIKSVQTPEQFAVAQKYAQRMSGTIMKHQHDNSGFGSGLRANLKVMRAIEADLKAKAAELGIEYQELEETGVGQVEIKPASQTQTQVIQQGNKTLGTVNNPQLAQQIKQSIGKGEMTLNPDEQQMAEGKDEGKPGKNFAKIAKSAGKEYGSKAAGERVAGAVRNKLKAQGKLEEGRDHTSSQYLDEEIAKILAREKPGMDTVKSNDEFYSAIYHELVQQGLKPSAARGKMMDDDFISDVASAYAQYQANPSLDEGSFDDFRIDGVNPTNDFSTGSKGSMAVPRGTPTKANRPVQEPTAWSVDPISAATDRAFNFVSSLGKGSTFKEGTSMKDIQLESWSKQLNGLLSEGITVSSSQGQQGAPDSVSVTATDNDATSLMSVLRNAGIGGFGAEPEAPEIGYGVAQGGEEEFDGTGTEPQAAPEVVGDDGDMLSMLKKMAGLSAGPVGGSEEGQDYEDEEGSEETALQPADDEEETSGDVDSDEEGAEEGSDDEEEQTDEGNLWGKNVRDAKQAGKKEADLDNDGDMDPVKEGEHECNECGMMESSCECDSEQVEEAFENETGNEEFAKLKALLSMGGDLHKQKANQTVGNPTQVSMAESLAQWKKLSGIK